MSVRVLIVEDEIFVATEIEHLVEEMGHDALPIASDQRSALRQAAEADVALVDLNLRDGPTGAQIGKILAQTHGVTVVFMTANPSQLGEGVDGTLGVLSKPVTDRELQQAVRFAVARRCEEKAVPPQRFRIFETQNSSTLPAASVS